MSRLENLPRIAASEVKSKSWNYIHYYFLNQDISEALRKYATGDLLDLGRFSNLDISEIPCKDMEISALSGLAT